MSHWSLIPLVPSTFNMEWKADTSRKHNYWFLLSPEHVRGRTKSLPSLAASHPRTRPEGDTTLISLLLMRGSVLERQRPLQSHQGPRQSFQLFDSKASIWLLYSSAAGSRNFVCVIKTHTGNLQNACSWAPPAGLGWGSRGSILKADSWVTLMPIVHRPHFKTRCSRASQSGSREAPGGPLETAVHVWREP